MEELCAARTQDEVIRIGAAFAKKACSVDSVSVVLTSGEYFHDAPGGRPERNTQAVRTRVVIRMSAWALEAGQTVVVPDVQRDERTRSHTNGSGGVRSLVVVPVGGRTPFAAITCAWAQERWPAATDVLVLEALARATGLALTSRLSRSLEDESDETNAIAAWLGEAADAEGLRGLERQRKLVSADFQHRARNLLGLVRSLVRRTAETSTSIGDYTARLEGRISALARAEAFAMRDLPGGVELGELVDAELNAHTAAREHAVECVGPPVKLRPKTAETLALALHELASNAARFGALSLPEAHLRITWRKLADRADPCVRFEWREEGVRDCAPPARRGFGSDLIENTVPYELRGASRLTFGPGGVCCTIDIPLTRDNVVE